MARRKTHPIIPVILSFMVMGTGQIFNGEIKKGVALFLFNITLMSLVTAATFLAVLEGKTTTSTPTIFSIFVDMIIFIPWILLWIWNVIDAYRNAK